MLIVDTHTHIYGTYNVKVVLKKAFATRSLFIPEDTSSAFVLCLSERYDCHFFRTWTQAAPLKIGSFLIEKTNDAQVLRILNAEGKLIYLVAGRQIVTQERLEVLALGKDLEISDGLSLDEVIGLILSKNALPVLTWAPGKWLFKRGLIIQEALYRWNPSELLIGDTSLRPRFFPPPRLIKKARRKHFRVIAGSDPLPPAHEAENAAKYLTKIEVKLEDGFSSEKLLNALRDSNIKLKLIGRRSTLGEAFTRLRRHSKQSNSDNKKVLFIAPQPYFQWRGSPIRVDFNVRALAELGYQIDLLVMPFGEERNIQGVTIHRAANPFKIRNLTIGPSPAKFLLDIFLLWKALSLARKNKYSIVHGVEDAGIIALQVAKLNGSCFVFEKHSDSASYKRGPIRNLVMYFYSKVEARCIRKADGVIGTGPSLVKQVHNICQTTPGYHIPDIPSSLVEANSEKVKILRAGLLEKQDELLLTYVGSFAVYQGIDLMFECIPKVVGSNPQARFIIIGGTEKQIEERRNWLAERGIEKSVTFLGKIPPDDLPNYLAASDILLSPRNSGKNTPLKLLDYLKAAQAIVACKIEANCQILDDTNAILTNPNPDDFAKGICRLLADTDLRAKLAAAGADLIAKTYNFKQFKKGLKECYDVVLANKQTNSCN